MTARQPLPVTRVWLRADCDFLTEKARFSYSTDGKRFEPLGGELTTGLSSSRPFRACATLFSTTTLAAPRRLGGLRRLTVPRAAPARAHQADPDRPSSSQ